jgi:hypothetical protein
MQKTRIACSFLAACLAALTLVIVAASCGSGASMGASQLQSITVNPPTANAENYPNGEVPFEATGNYINPTRKVTPQAASWVACSQNAQTSDASVTSSGVAQCASGAEGTYNINAFVITNCTAITACGGGCTVVGSAQLTCP